jgi:uncharacterized cupin superfamily protein
MEDETMPKIEYDNLPIRTRTPYPLDLNKVTEGFTRVAVGDGAGLTQFGVNRAVLQPGAATALRHWHEHEDEFVIVLAGIVTLVDDTGEHELTAGDCAGFKAGEPNGHHIVNRSSSPAILFEIGTRSPNEVAHYSDVDLVLNKIDGQGHFTRRDGSRVTEK